MTLKCVDCNRAFEADEQDLRDSGEHKVVYYQRMRNGMMAVSGVADVAGDHCGRCNDKKNKEKREKKEHEKALKIKEMEDKK